MAKNFTEAKKLLKEHGIVVRATGYDKEHRVNYKKGREETAYYTDDPADAHGTGMHMAKNAMKEFEHPYWQGKR